MARQYFIETGNGNIFEISELDFNNIQGRIARGQTKGWYSQRGDNIGDRCQWRIQFDEIASTWSNKPKREDRPVRNLDVQKHVPPQVKKPEEPEDLTKCPHNWNVEEDYEFVTTIVNGLNRYYKMCKKCGGKSQLVKKREVELAMEKNGLTINDVELVK